MARIIDFVSQLPSDKLVVMISGFSDLAHNGLYGLYNEQIQDLISRGYDVLMIPLPSHQSCANVSFSDPTGYPEKLEKTLREIFEHNGQKKFRIIAFSAAAAAVTHCWAKGGEEYIKAITFISPAFDFKPRIFWRLTFVLSIYYLIYCCILGLNYFSFFFTLLLPVWYFGSRLIRVNKNRVRQCELDNNRLRPCYPLLASARLLFLQRKVKRAVKKHALFKLPLLVIYAKNDPMVHFGYTERLFLRDLQATIVVVDSGCHSILITQWKNPDLQRAWNRFFASSA